MTCVMRSGAVAFAFAFAFLGVLAGASPAAADEITGGCTALVNGQDGALLTRDDPLVVQRRRAGRDHREHPGGVRAAEPDEPDDGQGRGDRRADRRDERRAGERRSDLLGRRRERRRLLRRRRRPVSRRGHEPRRRMGLRVQRVPPARGGHAVGPDRLDRARRDHRRRGRRVPHEGSQAEGTGLDRRRPRDRRSDRTRGSVASGRARPSRRGRVRGTRRARLGADRAIWRPTSG